MAPAFPLAGHRLPWPPQTALPRAAARALLQLLPAGGWPPVPGATNCQAGPAACCRSLTAHRSQRSQSGCSPASTSTNVDGVLCRTASLMHLLLRARPAEEQQLGVRQVDCQPPPLAVLLKQVELLLQACCYRYLQAGPASCCCLLNVHMQRMHVSWAWLLACCSLTTSSQDPSCHAPIQGLTELKGWQFYAVTHATLRSCLLLAVQVGQAASAGTAASAAASSSAASLGANV